MSSADASVDFEGDFLPGRTGSGGLLHAGRLSFMIFGLEKVHNKTARHVPDKLKDALMKLPATQRHSATLSAR